MIVLSDWIIVVGAFQLKYSILILDLLDINFFQKAKSDTQFSLPHAIKKGNCLYIYTLHIYISMYVDKIIPFMHALLFALQSVFNMLLLQKLSVSLLFFKLMSCSKYWQFKSQIQNY